MFVYSEVHGLSLFLTPLLFMFVASRAHTRRIWSWFLIPSMPQAVGSTLAVLDRDFASVKVRARQRFLGCALGAGLGLDALPVYATVLFAGIFFSRLHNGGGPQSYIGTQGGIAFITAMVTGAGPPSSSASR
ncbi:hypothetical protein V5F59_17975 [Xanthobacter autotrophicus DSM 431]|uniref:hypothetical protein n=1 Tax=Xanthobacter nonsaccharivorans TaxID=3119912 RepID=UPI003729CBDE